MRRKAARPFPWKIFYRTLLMQSGLVLLALIAALIAVRYYFERQFVFQIETRVHEALTLLAHNLPADIDQQWCAREAKGTAFRLVITRRSGHVVCDSQPGSEALPVPLTILNQVPERLSPEDQFTRLVRGNSMYASLGIPPRNLVLYVEAPLTHVSQSLTIFDASMGIFTVLAVLALAALAVWSARQLVFPLARLLVKTQTVLAGGQPEPVSSEDFQRESFDEWIELESNIDDIRRDLAAKAHSLSMEQVELETIMSSISDAVLAVDTEGNPMFFNSRFELLFGGANGPGLRKRNLKLWGIFRDPDVLSAFTAALKEGKTGSTKAVPVDQPGGLRRYFSLSVSPLRRDGTVYGAVGIFHDVTELKSAEQMRIDFVANVSHELRTPLTVIKGYADTMIEDEKKAGGGPSLDYLKSIARNANRLMELMNDLLDLSSIESTDILVKDPLSTEELTVRTLSALSAGFEEKHQRVVTRFQAPTVVADPQRVEQVLTNLLSNANKYTPNDGQITVAWEPDGRDVLLKVSNTGPGIPLEYQARLFERFYRIDKARSREAGGTGLGLAIVKHIMQRHQGNVWVESAPPQSGATFICRFPGAEPKRESPV